MKPFKPMLFRYLLLLLIALIVTPTVTMGNEQQREAIEKDYRKVLKEKNPEKQVKKHRELVNKWKMEGHLDLLISLYETDAVTAHSNAGLHYGLGYAYAIQGRIDTTQTDLLFEKAANQFERTLSLVPTLSQAHFSLGAIYQEQGKLGRAVQALETCLELDSKHYPAYYRLGDIYLQQDNFQAALEAFQAVQKINKKWARPYYGIGVVHLKQGNDNLAREAFEEAIYRDPKFALAHFKLGQVLAREGFFDEAWGEYETGKKYQPYTADLLYELGTIFDEAGNRDGAIYIFRRVIDDIDPRHTVTLLQLGEIYYAAGEEAVAIEHYKQAIEADPALRDYFMEQLEPYHAGLMGRAEAKSILERFLAVIPDDPRATFYSAQIETVLGNLTAAIEYYEETIALIGTDATELDVESASEYLLEAHRFIGDAYYRQGAPEKARAAYKRSIELDPELERYFFNQGRSAFDAEQFDLAIEPFDKFILIYPEDIEATYLLGRSHESSGSLDYALHFYTRTLELDLNHREALTHAAQIYRTQNDPQNALIMLMKLAAIEPNSVEARYLIGSSHVALEHYREALDAFLETVRLDPHHLDAHLQIASLYEKQGDTDNAIQQYETVITLDPSEAAPLLRLGWLYLQRGDTDNAIRVYEPGLEIEPNHPQTQYDLAVLFEERGEMEKAIKHFGLANRYDGGHFDWHYRYARLLDRYAEGLEDYDTYAAMAVAEYNQTIELKNDYAPAYLHRGLITRRYKQIGDTLYRYSQITEDFKRVIAIEPNNSDAHYYLGMTYMDLDQHQDAKAIFLKTVQFGKEYTGVYLQLGLIAEREEKYEEAIRYFEKELEIDSESITAYQRLGYLYSDYSTEFGRAAVVFEKALALQPNHVTTLNNYGRTLYSLNRHGAAIEQFELVIQLDPKNLTANYNLAVIYQYTGKKRLAINRWKKFLELEPPDERKTEAEEYLQQLQP